MNPCNMATSLPNSIYNAVNAISSYQQDFTYGNYSEFQGPEFRMEEGQRLQYSDFMNNDSADLIQALESTDFHPLATLTLTDTDMSFLHSDLMTSDSHDTGGSEGQDDITSDYSDSGSCFSDSYEHSTVSIMEDKPDFSQHANFQTEELLDCQPMEELFRPECLVQRNTSQKKKPGRKKGQTSKVLHLWEFIRDLLKDPQFNGNIIQWENKADGVFRVVKSSEVASLWGKKKKNKKEMTYEKMSRSMRYSRKEGYFIDLPKDSGYPKKLCFRFGPKSTGWQ